MSAPGTGWWCCGILHPWKGCPAAPTNQSTGSCTQHSSNGDLATHRQDEHGGHALVQHVTGNTGELPVRAEHGDHVLDNVALELAGVDLAADERRDVDHLIYLSKGKLGVGQLLP